VFGKKPIGIMPSVELAVGSAGIGGRELKSRDVGLNLLFPKKFVSGVSLENLAGEGHVFDGNGIGDVEDVP
jgi:hypothetical protein